MKTILLVEDDFLNRRLSKKNLIENGYRVVEAKNAQEAFDILDKESVTLAVLDINLGTETADGIHIGEELQRKYGIPFVYLTAYDTANIVSQAVATAPHAYLTKPFKSIDLLTSIALAIQQFDARGKKKSSLLVKDGAYHVDLLYDEIDYIEAEGNYLLFHANDKMYKSRCTIRQIAAVLPSSIFVQSHRAFVVNKTKVEKFNIKNLVLGRRIIPVSKNYLNNIRAAFSSKT